jgi:hypothetical protein
MESRRFDPGLPLQGMQRLTWPFPLVIDVCRWGMCACAAVCVLCAAEVRSLVCSGLRGLRVRTAVVHAMVCSGRVHTCRFGQTVSGPCGSCGWRLRDRGSFHCWNARHSSGSPVPDAPLWDKTLSAVQCTRACRTASVHCVCAGRVPRRPTTLGDVKKRFSDSILVGKSIISTSAVRPSELTRTPTI